MTALQLRWMYENALNLQAMSFHGDGDRRRRESLRLCDGEMVHEEVEEGADKENRDPGCFAVTASGGSITASRDDDDDAAFLIDARSREDVDDDRDDGEAGELLVVDRFR